MATAKKRSKSSEEAAFVRGDVGVDGQATEEAKEIAEVERDKAREQFLRGKAYLGREFLTWLLWKSEAGDPILSFEDRPVVVALTARITLRGIIGEVVETTLRGAMAPYSPLVRRSLDRGLLVHQARLKIMHGEDPYDVTVDAEFFDLKSAKLPVSGTGEEDEQLQERLGLSERLSAIVSALIEAFLQVRSGRRWAKEVAEMKAWMAEAAE